MTAKRCKTCGLQKPLYSFYSHVNMADGRASTCKECKKDSMRLWYRANREYRLEYGKQYQLAHPEKRMAHRKRYAQRHPEKFKLSQLQSRVKARRTLSDTYIKNLICNNWQIRRESIPAVLVQLCRTRILIKRKIKTKANENHPRNP